MKRASARQGFTLIELLIVVVIVGLLAAIAIPKFAATKDKAHMAAMRGDLRNLTTAQEAYAADYAVYYSGAVPSAQLLYNPSPGINVVILEADATGWSAKATTPLLASGSAVCAIYIGSAAPVAPATKDGSIICET